MMPTKKYTTEFKSSIVSLYNEGRSTNSLANEYHLAVQTVTGWVKKAVVGTDINGQPVTQTEFEAMKKEVAHLKEENDIYSVMVRRFNKPTTTVEYKQRPNLIKGLCDANVWSMDITYLKLNNGQWFYLTSVLELRIQTILSHQISATLDTKLVVSTMQRALSRHSKPNYSHTRG